MTKKNSKAKTGHKEKYERSTPVGRVLKNLEKAEKALGLATERLGTWLNAENPQSEIKDVLERVTLATDEVARAAADMKKLEASGWSPPKKSLALVYEPSERVKISDRYRNKYLKIYTPAVIDSLVVVKMLESGEVAVKSTGSSTPFFVAKSHIERRPTDE